MRWVTQEILSPSARADNSLTRSIVRATRTFSTSIGPEPIWGRDWVDISVHGGTSAPTRADDLLHPPSGDQARHEAPSHRSPLARLDARWILRQDGARFTTAAPHAEDVHPGGGRRDV